MPTGNGQIVTHYAKMWPRELFDFRKSESFLESVFAALRHPGCMCSTEMMFHTTLEKQVDLCIGDCAVMRSYRTIDILIFGTIFPRLSFPNQRVSERLKESS